MKCIPLRARDGSVRAYALVDDGDYDALDERRWCLSSPGGYAQRGTSENGRSYSIFMHRQILGLGRGRDDPRLTDHINGNRLDNRRCNLRVVTSAENAQNKRLNANNSSGYKGVYWNRECQKWQAYGKVNGRIKYLGLFNDLEAAAKVAHNYRARHLPFSREAAA